MDEELKGALGFSLDILLIFEFGKPGSNPYHELSVLTDYSSFFYQTVFFFIYHVSSSKIRINAYSHKGKENYFNFFF